MLSRSTAPATNRQAQSAGSTQANAGGAAAAPSLSLPKGGGAIRGIGEKFAANPVTGTGSMSAPIATSPGRSGFGPQLSLTYDSGAGNGPFGFGWNLSLPAITRKTDKGLPQYRDAEESDVFILSGAEDLVPVLVESGGQWQRQPAARTVNGVAYSVQRYRPRTEGMFARIERWTNIQTGEIHWRSISRDNITTLYGKDSNSRIADPDALDAGQPQRIFSWLICESYDDKGNAIVYEYKAEDSAGVDLTQAHEQSRTPASRSANRYLKRISYGNRVSRLIQPDLAQADWMFEVVFDYGEHDRDAPKPGDAGVWLCRRDPFSSYRSGFDVRTYRLCQRVLMFHHFPSEAGVGQDCLVRSTDVVYRNTGDLPDAATTEHPVAAFIAAITHNGYRRQASGYLKKSLPPLEFSYSLAEIHEEVREIDAESLENLPYGLDDTTYQWVDLDGEGVSGILTEQANAWFYKPNLGEGRFGPLEPVAVKPSLADLGGGRQQLLDLAGDGQLDLVEFGGSTPGFFERTQDQHWERFTPFASLPNIPWGDPSLHFVDLNGDGHADILIGEDEVYTWYPSLAEAGFGPARHVRTSLDEDTGPGSIFADGTQSIYLADMSGDGLTDLVRVRNGEVCYWPNLGYGRFGAKITMDDAPWFDAAEQFDQRRIRMADIDGSGTTDIIYLGRDNVRLYFNQSGNRWSAPRWLRQFPYVDNLSAVTAVDLLGNGTACLVWSSPLPGAVRRPMRYIDLMGGQKPHMLTSIVNNMGMETEVFYVSSTQFYLADKAAGRPWITRLPFPVHVVERMETRDRVGGNHFVTRYAYHHGYFDGVEREFHGFGLVEQWDTEEFAALAARRLLDATNVDTASHIPPVLTKTWFHTGAYFDSTRITQQFDDEYYREADLGDAQLRAMLLDDTVLPDTIRLDDGSQVAYALSAEEAREAARALKGAVLRQEIYALDGTEAENRPYSVSERNYTIELVQPAAANRNAVLFSYPRENINYFYDRALFAVQDQQLADPRVSHTMTLATDAFGNVLRSAATNYGRRYDDPDPLLTDADRARQRRPLITCAESSYTNAIQQDDAYRTPLMCEARTYELLNITPAANEPQVTNLFRFEELLSKVQAAGDGRHDIPYEDVEGSGAATDEPYRRLIEHARVLYRRDDLGDPLPLGQLQSFALPFQSYKLALTPGLLARLYKRNAAEQPLLPEPASVLGSEGGYIHSSDLQAGGWFPAGDSDDSWWTTSGQVFFSADSADSPAQELAYARAHFFLPHRFRDPFGQFTSVAYDAYSLLALETRDTLGNRTTAGDRDRAGTLVKPSNDYRVLQPSLVMDPNRNRSAVAFDALGMVVGTALMGKPGESSGDSLDGFAADLADDIVAAHLENPLAAPLDILQGASTRLVYDLFAYWRTRSDPQPQPGVVYTLAREMHDSDLPAGQRTRTQHRFSYSDGFGREIQKKNQAEPGPLVEGETEIDPRWVGSGWVIFNNKGKPIRQYEPFFSTTHHFEFATIAGVSPILFYDPAERVVATLHPNHTYEKVVFDPWRQAIWDVHDTVLQAEPKDDSDVGDFFRRLPDAEYLPTWYAQRQGGEVDPQEQAAATKTAVHANTPTLAYFDPLGRPFLTVTHNRFALNDTIGEETSATRVNLDIESNEREVIDDRGRIVARYDYDMLGNRLHQASMEAGERWLLGDVVGKPIYGWNNRNHTLHTTYDALRRPTDVFLRESNGPELLVERTVYGETRLDAEARNLRGQVYQIFDSAGVVTSEAYDFKGNLLRSSRQLAVDYKNLLDWSAGAALEPQVYANRTTYDALNRPVLLTTPDGSVVRSFYNEANLLERMEVSPRGAAVPASVIDDIDYNAKGQRTLIAYGNGVRTRYSYDPLTARLARQITTRGDAFPDDCPNPAKLPCGVQNLRYTYDPSGNITAIRDDAQQTIYFRNQRIEPSAEYTYDALYRLIEATGREHLGQTSDGAIMSPAPTDNTDAPRTGLLHPGDGNAMGRYIEQYAYDTVGNFLEMIHRGSDPSNPGWTRAYSYNEPSQLEPATTSNRLTSTQLGRDLTDSYSYDAHGNMITMPHLPLMRWDFRDQLQASSQQRFNQGGTPETTYYVYDASGQRVRKVTERQSSFRRPATRKAERIYLGGFEIYREYGGSGSDVTLERETLHIVDDQQRIALIETRTQGSDDSPAQLIRYQLGNHLGSVCLELDDHAAIISYEEYYPYGSTSYQAVRNQTETPKRYRYSGKERDTENGLYYHGARYYAPWLGRWTSCDPAGIRGSVNAYMAYRNAPTRFVDPSGNTDFEPAGSGWQRRDISINIDEPQAVGEPGISPQEAMRRAKDLNNRQILDQMTNQATKGPAREVPITPRTTNLPPVSVVDQPSALVYRPTLGGIKEWDELSAIILKEQGARLQGKSAKQVKEILNSAIREELKAPKTEPGRLLSGALRNQFGKDAKDLFSAKQKFKVPWGSARFKGFLAVLGAAVTLMSTEASAASFNVSVPASANQAGDKPPASMKDVAQVQLQVSSQLADVTSNAPGGLLATSLSLGVSVDAIRTLRSLEQAQMTNQSQFNGRLQPVENAPYMLDTGSGKVYGINMGDDDPSRKGELSPVGQFETGFGAAHDFFYSGQNVFYKDNGKWYLGHW